MSINDRIKYIIDVKKLNKNSFSNKVSIQPQTLHHIVGGRLTKPSFEVLEKIITTYSDINPVWLISGKGQPFLHPKVSLHLQEGTDNLDVSFYKKIDISKQWQEHSAEIFEETSYENFLDSNTNKKETDLLKEKLDSKKRQIESLERQIASLESNMQMMLASKDQMLSMKDEVIKLKEEALKRNQEIIKEKDDFIATQKAYIENLKKKESIIDALEIPHSKKVTFVKKGNTTEITEIKKGWPDGRNADITLPIQNT